ncbi:MAG: mismatch-specific DNA-glycosylase [Vicinamibacterales bacterium]
MSAKRVTLPGGKGRRLPESVWAHRRLTDCLRPGIRVLLVGINPGVMSAATGHHFAGPSNRFWKLLYESGLVPERISHDDDVGLPDWGFGMTNLVARPSPGIDDLRPREYLDGWRVLEEKIARYRPEIVAFVGVTMYRALWKVLGHVPGAKSLAAAGGPIIKPGFQRATIHGARIFVLPNPSGRNANFTYAEMLAAFRALRRAMRKRPASGAETTTDDRTQRPQRPQRKK